MGHKMQTRGQRAARLAHTDPALLRPSDVTDLADELTGAYASVADLKNELQDERADRREVDLRADELMAIVRPLAGDCPRLAAALDALRRVM